MPGHQHSPPAYQDVLAEVDDDQAARLWQVVDVHAQRGGVCPVCGTARRCWERAYAIERLIVAGRYHQPRPA